MTRLSNVFLLLPLLPLATAVHAQVDRSERILEEVIVTATKRESSLQDTAIAITALSSSMLEDMDINSAFALEALVPSLTFQQSPNRISIRGVGRFDNQLGTNPGVGIYTDGVYSAEATALASEPINVDRIEVLRGPQGTLYGRNSTGGAINVITKRPTEEFFLDFRVKAGNYDLQQFDLLVSGPINDDVRYKLYANDSERDGLHNNKAGTDLKSVNNKFAEGQLEWDISSNLNLWLKYREDRYDRIPGAGDSPGINPSEDPYDCVNEAAGLSHSVQYKECQQGRENVSVNDPRDFAQNNPGELKFKNHHNMAAQLTYDLPSATAKYLYGNIKYDWDITNVDYDQTPNDFSVLLDNGQHQEQESHEFQLASEWDKSWTYLIGLYYFNDENDQPYKIHAPDSYDTMATVGLDGQSWDNPDHIFYFQRGTVKNESWAIFGESVIDLNEEWDLTLGARYSVDDFKGQEVQLQYYDLTLISPTLTGALDVSEEHFAGDPTRYTNTVDASYKDDYENLTGKITLSYHPIDEHMFWGTIANGYKMGGVRLGSLEKFYAESEGLDSNGEFDQEDMIMVELGWKAELLDNRLRTEVVAFNYTYDDMQQTRQTVRPPSAIILSEVVNVDVEMYGLETTATALVSDNLTAFFTFSYNHSEVTQDAYLENFTYGARDDNGEIIPDNIEGNTLALTPKYKTSLTLQYLIPTDIGEFTIGGTASYVDDRYFELDNYDAVGNHSLLDLQASWTSSTGRYKILGSVKNATDETVYNTYHCQANTSGVYGTDSFIPRCGGNLMDQRLYSVQFMYQM